MRGGRTDEQWMNGQTKVPLCPTGLRPLRGLCPKKGTHPTAAFLQTYQQMDLLTVWIMNLITCKRVEYLKIAVTKTNRINGYPSCVWMGRGSDRRHSHFRHLKLWAHEALNGEKVKRGITNWQMNKVGCILHSTQIRIFMLLILGYLCNVIQFTLKRKYPDCSDLVASNHSLSNS